MDENGYALLCWVQNPVRRKILEEKQILQRCWFYAFSGDTSSKNDAGNHFKIYNSTVSFLHIETLCIKYYEKCWKGVSPFSIIYSPFIKLQTENFWK